MERKNTDGEEQIDESKDLDDAVIAADDTGMLGEERLIAQTEIEEGLEGSDDSGA